MVRAAAAGEVGLVVEDLIAAFVDDPVLSWAFPDAARRRRHGRRFFALQARRLIPAGLAWRADGAAALWAAPGTWRVPVAESARLAFETLAGAGPRHGARVIRGMLGVEHRHLREPHLYLATIGVRPGSRGKGLGSALLEPGLRWADERHLPAYLESSNPRNLTLYERAGFVTTDEVRLPQGPLMTLMRRPPR